MIVIKPLFQEPSYKTLYTVIRKCTTSEKITLSIKKLITSGPIVMTDIFNGTSYETEIVKERVFYSVSFHPDELNKRIQKGWELHDKDMDEIGIVTGRESRSEPIPIDLFGLHESFGGGEYALMYDEYYEAIFRDFCDSPQRGRDGAL